MEEEKPAKEEVVEDAHTQSMADADELLNQVANAGTQQISAQATPQKANLSPKKESPKKESPKKEAKKHQKKQEPKAEEVKEEPKFTQAPPGI